MNQFGILLFSGVSVFLMCVVLLTFFNSFTQGGD